MSCSFPLKAPPQLRAKALEAPGGLPHQRGARPSCPIQIRPGELVHLPVWPAQSPESIPFAPKTHGSRKKKKKKRGEKTLVGMWGNCLTHSVTSQNTFVGSLAIQTHGVQLWRRRIADRRKPSRKVELHAAANCAACQEKGAYDLQLFGAFGVLVQNGCRLQIEPRIVTQSLESDHFLGSTGLCCPLTESMPLILARSDLKF